MLHSAKDFEAKSKNKYFTLAFSFVWLLLLFLFRSRGDTWSFLCVSLSLQITRLLEDSGTVFMSTC